MQQRVKFHPMLSCRETMAADPAVSRRTLVKRAKEEASRKDAERRREELKALPQQGQMKRDSSQEAEQVWGSVVSNLSPEVMKFALNAATDTLPHNSNLAKWRKGSVSDVCKLCGGKQTLLHVLSNCPVALRQRRYNQRHDRVLSILADLAKSYLPSSFAVTADLPDTEYCFPLHATSTDLRPDLVLWSDENRELALVELTVCFESGVEGARARKRDRYLDLKDAATDGGFKTTIILVQVGSRGVVDLEGLLEFKCLLDPIPCKIWKSFVGNISCTALIESLHIWCRRNWSE